MPDYTYKIEVSKYIPLPSGVAPGPIISSGVLPTHSVIVWEVLNNINAAYSKAQDIATEIFGAGTLCEIKVTQNEPT